MDFSVYSFNGNAPLFLEVSPDIIKTQSLETVSKIQTCIVLILRQLVYYLQVSHGQGKSPLGTSISHLHNGNNK